MCFIYSRTVKTRPCSRTSWSSGPWNSKSSAGNSTWGNRPPPWKGSQSVNKSTEWTWPWLTDGLSQRHIPVESTIHFTLSTHTPPRTQAMHTHMHTHITSSHFFLLHWALYHPLYSDKIFFQSSIPVQILWTRSSLFVIVLSLTAAIQIGFYKYE